MERWVEYAVGRVSLSPWPMVRLGELATRAVEPIDRTGSALSDLNVIAKITFGGELHIRSEKEKIGYKGPLFAASPGDLVISKIRVAQGSFCVVPDEIGKLAVSPEYPVYRVAHDQILGQYLSLALRTEPFLSSLYGLKSGGTTKSRIRPTAFENLELPVPNLEMQRRLVADYDTEMDEAQRLEEAAKALEQQAQTDFEAALGLAPPPPLPDKPLFIARFSDIERWSHEGMLRASLAPPSPASGGGAGGEGQWPMVHLGEVISDIRHGCSSGPSKSPTPLRVLKLSAVTKGFLDPTEHKYMLDRDDYRQQFAIHKGDVLMCRTNGTLAYVGMSALAEEAFADLIYPDKLIRLRLDMASISPPYLWRLLQLPALRNQIERSARTAVGNFAIGSRDVRQLVIPLPRWKPNNS